MTNKQALMDLEWKMYNVHGSNKWAFEPKTEEEKQIALNLVDGGLAKEVEGSTLAKFKEGLVYVLTDSGVHSRALFLKNKG